MTPTWPPTQAGPVWRGCGRAGLLALSLPLVAACSAVVDVRPLATGRVDVAAYTLRGADLAPVRQEAERLCPRGGEVVYQASRGQHKVPAEGRVNRWLQTGTAWLDTPRNQVQMTVVCNEMPGDRVLMATPAPRPADKSPAPPQPAALGPLAIEW